MEALSSGNNFIYLSHIIYFNPINIIPTILQNYIFSDAPSLIGIFFNTYGICHKNEKKMDVKSGKVGIMLI